MKNKNIIIFACNSLHPYYNYYYPAIMDYKFINTEYLDSVSGGDLEIIYELVNLFKEQSVEIYNEMQSHFSVKNYKMLGFLAHKAKSSVLIMGMNDLGLMLKTFEIQARDEKESYLYESYITRFKTETEAAITELDDLVNNHLNRN
jgi:hypothetical protein